MISCRFLFGTNERYRQVKLTLSIHINAFVFGMNNL